MRFEYNVQFVPDMKKFLPLLFLLFAVQLSGQNTDKLDKEKGVFNLMLLAEVDTGFLSIFEDPDVYYPRYEFAMLESNYTYLGDSMPKAGDIKANKLFLSTYENRIASIKVVFPFDSAVIKWLERSYGSPTLPFRTTEYENNKAIWSIAIWQGHDVRMVYTAKKYIDIKDSEKSDVPDYIYIKITSLETEQLINRGEDRK
jgi:hypothetical protein